MDKDAVQQALSHLSLGPVRFYPQTGSTNDDANHWAQVGAPDLALVIAEEQTQGRGRLARSWFTPPGAALALSLVLRPDQTPVDAEQPQALARLTALGALAVCSALKDISGGALQPEIKWPNDVLLERQKTAGILVEISWEGERFVAAVLGIGINVSSRSVPPAKTLLFPATCVEAALGRGVERLELLRAVLEGVLFWRQRLNKAEFLQAWQEQLAFKGTWVQISRDDPSGVSMQEARLVGVRADGKLELIDREGKTITLETGEVTLRPAERDE
jgi:BirA family biotin operon repressor/biotin-[acetyl-CoA-carboxylase] ligase